MTMFYSESDERYLERKLAERRRKEMEEMVKAEVAKQLRRDDCPPGYLRTQDGHLIHVDDAMKGPRPE